MSRAGNKWRLARKSAGIVVCCLLIPLAEQGCKSGASPAERASKGGMGGVAIPVAVSRVIKKDVPMDIQGKEIE